MVNFLPLEQDSLNSLRGPPIPAIRRLKKKRGYLVCLNSDKQRHTSGVWMPIQESKRGIWSGNQREKVGG